MKTFPVKTSGLAGVTGTEVCHQKNWGRLHWVEKIMCPSHSAFWVPCCAEIFFLRVLELYRNVVSLERFWIQLFLPGGGQAEAHWPGWTGLGVSLVTGVPCRFMLSVPHGSRDSYWPGWIGLRVSLTPGVVPCRFSVSAPHGSHASYPFYR